MIIKAGRGISREKVKNDIYIDNPFQEVMFREDFKQKTIYQKFYGEAEIQDPISQYNELYNDSLLNGNEISKEEYLRGEKKVFKMTSCELFIEEIANFIVNNQVEGFSLTKNGAKTLMGYSCGGEQEKLRKMHKKKYVQYIFGPSDDSASLCSYNTLIELEEGLLEMMGNAFCIYNIPIIDGKVPEYKMMYKYNNQWELYKTGDTFNIQNKDKLIVWSSEISPKYNLNLLSKTLNKNKSYDNSEKFIKIFSEFNFLETLGFKLSKQEIGEHVISVSFKNKNNRVVEIQSYNHKVVNVLIINTATNKTIDVKRWIIVNSMKSQFELLFIGYPYSKNFEKRSLSLKKIISKLFSNKDLKNILKGDGWWEDEMFTFIE